MGAVFLKLIDGIDRLVDVVDFLLGGIDDATDEDQLVGWVVFDDESEGAVGLDDLLASRFADIESGDLVERVQILIVVQTAQSAELGAFVLFEVVHLVAGTGRGGDAVLGDLDGRLVDELVQVQFGLWDAGARLPASQNLIFVIFVQGSAAEGVEGALGFVLFVAADAGDS